MESHEKRPKNREVEDEMIRKPKQDHVPPQPATEPEKGETTRKDS